MVPTVTPDELKAAWFTTQLFSKQAQRTVSAPEFSRAVLTRCAQVAVRVERDKEPLIDELFREVAEMELP
jgi:hypothetical protein